MLGVEITQFYGSLLQATTSYPQHTLHQESKVFSKLRTMYSDH
jgi:hypothetical protein